MIKETAHYDPKKRLNATQIVDRMAEIKKKL